MSDLPALPDPQEGRKLEAAATEGPWWREYGDVTVARPDPRDAVERVDEPRDARVVRRADHWDMRDPRAIADASLIVWLRNNAAALLDAAEANQRVREMHQRTTEEGYAAVCVWGDCDHDKAGECPTRNFDVCEHCMAVVDATGFADSGEVWPSAVLWPCPTIRMLGGESE